MKRTLTIVASFLLFIGVAEKALGCTSGIFTGKVTADGRPLLWKHRDTRNENNKVAYYKGEKYSFIGLVASGTKGGSIWIGTNNKGFSIMNTASYNIKDPDRKASNKPGQLMYRALEVCATVEEFDNFLTNLPADLREQSANFGVIDAEGGAAYFEVSNTHHIKFDVNDPTVAPNGYLLYTNHSFSGRHNEGAGYVRYHTASELVSKRLVSGTMSPDWIFNNLSRSFYHSLLGSSLTDQANHPERFSGWAIDQDYIPRRTSTATTVIQGVYPGENPEMTIFWSILGYPPSGVAIPLFEKAGKNLPTMVAGNKQMVNSPFCDYSVALKHKTFPLERGNGNKYFNFSLIHNSEGTGYMQQITKAEEYVYDLFRDKIDHWRHNGLKVSELAPIYNDIEQRIEPLYKELLKTVK